MRKKSYAIALLGFLSLTTIESYARQQLFQTQLTSEYHDSDLDVSYIYDNTENPKYIFVVIKNSSDSPVSFEFEISLNERILLNSLNQFTVNPGDELIGDDMTLAIPYSRDIALDELTTTFIYR